MIDISAVRKRPAMYVGSLTDGTGLHNLVFELASNAIKEALAGYCSLIDVTLDPDGSVTVVDDGRGLPVDRDTRSGIPKAEILATRLSPHARYDNLTEIPDELSGVGLFAVNALSAWFNMRIWRDGLAHSIGFADGEMIAPLKVTGASDGKRGTEISFLPSSRVFSDVGLGFAILEHRFRTLGPLGADAVLTLKDRRDGRKQTTVFRV